MKRRETPCTECGMTPRDAANHPYLACLAFKACKDARTVEENLAFVQSRAAQAERHRLEAEFKRELRRARGKRLGYVEVIVDSKTRKACGVLEDTFSRRRLGFESDALVADVLVKRGAAKGAKR